MAAAGEDYSQLWERMPEAFVHFEVVFNNDGSPADYVILAVNPAFETIARVAQPYPASSLKLRWRRLPAGNQR